MDAKMIDRDGKWFVNTAMFRFNDPSTGNNFEPGVPTRANQTEWMKGQPLIKEVADPYGDLPASVQAETPPKLDVNAPPAKRR